VRTKTGPSDSAGSGTSSSFAEWAVPGTTVIARIATLDCSIRIAAVAATSFGAFGRTGFPEKRDCGHTSTPHGEKCSRRTETKTALSALS
jgi:hypothetical protein